MFPCMNKIIRRFDVMWSSRAMGNEAQWLTLADIERDHRLGCEDKRALRAIVNQNWNDEEGHELDVQVVAYPVPAA